MRTTVRLPDDLYRRAKAHAATTGVSFTQLLEDALRAVLQDGLAAEERTPYRVRPLAAGDGLHPGVDLDDQAALLDFMDDA